jgi:cardiolipin synthase (CMP-forming)
LRHLPNLICLARIALIWPIVVALIGGNYDLALFLLTVAAVSDGLDGYLAKRFGWTSELGKILDPLADKLLIITLFLVDAWIGLVPWWLTVTAVTRDVAIVIGAFVWRFWIGPLTGRPSITSKINTGLQLAYLLGVITHAAARVPPQGFLSALAVIIVITTLLSGVNYAVVFARRASDARAKTQ